MSGFSIPTMSSASVLASASILAVSIATESSVTSSLGPAPEIGDSIPNAPTSKVYSSHPIANLTIGRFTFEKARLELQDADDIAEFEAELEWLAKNQPTLRNNVKTMDLAAAEAFAARFSPAAHQGGSDTAMIRAGVAVQAAMSNTGPVGA